MPRSFVYGFVLAALFVSITQPGCSCGASVHHGGPDSGRDIDSSVAPGDGSVPTTDSGTPVHDDGGYLRSCAPDSPDTEGCGCTTGDPTRGCWPFTLDPMYRHIGACTDGTQECVPAGEFGTWGACNGAYPPMSEYCGNNGIDENCDGFTDCSDPTCAGDPACNTGTCPEFSTRACYDGPDGTVGVGTCRAGMQTCSANVWGPCMGEVLPAAEDCAGTDDRNCNHAAGCWDLFVCIADPACMEHCPMPLDPGCVCADGSGDVATCPRGMHARTGGTIGGTLECCPCTTSDCGGGDTNCCEEPVCAGSAYCHGLYCPGLPASCMGRVDADCDDFPEDCDEPCCECYGDCSGP